MTLAQALAAAPEASVTPPPRLRPALVNGQRIHLECPSWCTEDHVAANERHLEDVCHTSGTTDLMAPRLDAPARLLAYARVVADACGDEEARRPLVTVDIEDVHGMYLQARDAFVFADGLVAFAEQVRALARVARGA